MARARLHLICGNCGCNDMWSYQISPQGTDIGGVLYPAVYLTCGCCATLHDIADNATNAKPNQQLVNQGDKAP